VLSIDPSSPAMCHRRQDSAAARGERSDCEDLGIFCRERIWGFRPLGDCEERGAIGEERGGDFFATIK
jgi:hypothetical protein